MNLWDSELRDRVRDLVTETGDHELFGDRRFVRDTLSWPKRLWLSETYDPHGMHRPRVHVCGLWGYCKFVASTPPSIGIMGPWPHVMIWLPYARKRGLLGSPERELSLRVQVRHDARDPHSWNWRTPVARAVYWIAGMVSKVKTYQQMSMIKWHPGWDHDWERWDAAHPEELPWEFIPTRRSWESVGWTWKVMNWSERIDPRHWEHWALDHSDCEDPTCSACGWCGGVTCNGRWEE